MTRGTVPIVGTAGFNFALIHAPAKPPKTAIKFSIRLFPSTYAPACNLALSLRVYTATKDQKMKTKSFFLLTTIAALLATAGTAQTNETSEAIALPKFVVTAPRHTDAEKQLNASLAEFRAQADLSSLLPRELRHLKAPALAQSVASHAAKDLLKLRLAKS